MNVLPDVSSLPSPDDIYVTMVSKKLKQDIKLRKSYVNVN